MSYVGEIQNCHLPKFIIQPLLENCFDMAFEIKNFPGKLIFKSIAPKNVGKYRFRIMDVESLRKNWKI